MRRRSLSSSKPDGSRLSLARGAFALRLLLIPVVLVGLLTVSLLYVTRPAQATTFPATTSGPWNLGATWGNEGNNVAGSGFPDAADTVNVPSGISVTIASGRIEACTALSLNSDAGNTAALNFTDGTSALSV